MSAQDYVALGLAAVALAYLVRRLVWPRRKRGGGALVPTSRLLAKRRRSS